MPRSESQQVAQRIITRFRERTRQSEANHRQAQEFLPGGDTRGATHFSPYPVYMEKGEGCTLSDCDGNAYLDLLNNYTSLIHGHAHPATTEALRKQSTWGTALGSPSTSAAEHARVLRGRLPSLEMIRYCNSGTEATMFAMRAARAFTNRSVFIKMDGGYHGSHDYVQVNIAPDTESVGLPTSRVENRGIPAAVMQDIIIVPFNSVDVLDATLEKHTNDVAAIILEPMLGSAGQIAPISGYLKSVRQLADRHQALLILDEVITFRLAMGGFQELESVEADLTALGKLIGGGLPVGAFGGREEIMDLFNPDRPDCLYHSGTFNGNNVTMAAGMATLQGYEQEEINRVNQLGDQLRNGIAEALAEVEVQGQVTGLGSLVGLHWASNRLVHNARDAAVAFKAAADLPKLLHLELMNQGVFSSRRGQYCISTPMTKSHVDQAIDKFASAFATLRPYIAEMSPHLIEQ